jgi:hypothetical protein
MFISFGPGGDTNQPTAFLTTKPLAATGFKTNQWPKARSSVFRKETTLTLDKHPWN